MKYSFSSQFLKKGPSDNNFGEAWESFCHDLLVLETGDGTILRLEPPDRGVDILRRETGTAYQCKSSVYATDTTLNAAQSVASLETAVSHRSRINWQEYVFATNANYSTDGLIKITEKARELDITDKSLKFYGPKYWSDLCEKYFDKVQHRLDYRLTITEEQVIEALRKARYFDKYISQFKEAIEAADFNVKISNNRIPLIIEMPFSPELTVENCLDAAQQLLGLTLDWANFSDLGTSAGSSISLTIRRKAQPFSTKLKDLPMEPDDELQLWIKIVWQDKKTDKGTDGDQLMFRFFTMTERIPVQREAISYSRRREETISRSEDLLQAMIWQAADRLTCADQKIIQPKFWKGKYPPQPTSSKSQSAGQ